MTEEFEKWWQDRYASAFVSMPGALQQAFIELAQEAWQASRKHALEEAAEKCDEVVGLGTVFVAGLTAAQACAERIRALQQQ